MDLVIAVYKEHVDRTLLEENLKKSVEERIQALEEFERLREELQAGVKAAQVDPIR
jgi:hypothetical protein